VCCVCGVVCLCVFLFFACDVMCTLVCFPVLFVFLCCFDLGVFVVVFVFVCVFCGFEWFCGLFCVLFVFCVVSSFFKNVLCFVRLGF